jgi:MSHA biogenesis protein MshE
MTGHMVLSTLHTNDAASAPARLLDMGIDHYLVSSSLRAVIAQRLIKKLCPHCRQNHELEAQERAWLYSMGEGADSHQYIEGRGCHHCHNTGYQGRIGIYELLEMTPELISALRREDMQAFSDATVRAPNFRSLSLSALDYARQGVTSLDEVFRVSATLDEG